MIFGYTAMAVYVVQLDGAKRNSRRLRLLFSLFETQNSKLNHVLDDNGKVEDLLPPRTVTASNELTTAGRSSLNHASRFE